MSKNRFHHYFTLHVTTNGVIEHYCWLVFLFKTPKFHCNASRGHGARGQYLRRAVHAEPSSVSAWRGNEQRCAYCAPIIITRVLASTQWLACTVHTGDTLSYYCSNRIIVLCCVFCFVCRLIIVFGMINSLLGTVSGWYGLNLVSDSVSSTRYNPYHPQPHLITYSLWLT